MPKDTYQKIRDAIQATLDREQYPTPRLVLARIKERAGKRWDKRDATAIQASIEAAGYRNVSVWLTGDDYRYLRIMHDPLTGPGPRGNSKHPSNSKREEYSLFMGIGTGLVCDPADVIARNPSYFTAADKRNAARVALLADPATLDRLAFAIDGLDRAVADVRAALDGPANAVKYEAIRAADLAALGELPLVSTRGYND